MAPSILSIGQVRQLLGPLKHRLTTLIAKTQTDIEDNTITSIDLVTEKISTYSRKYESLRSELGELSFTDPDQLARFEEESAEQAEIMLDVEDLLFSLQIYKEEQRQLSNQLNISQNPNIEQEVRIGENNPPTEAEYVDAVESNLTTEPNNLNQNDLNQNRFTLNQSDFNLNQNTEVQNNDIIVRRTTNNNDQINQQNNDIIIRGATNNNDQINVANMNTHELSIDVINPRDQRVNSSQLNFINPHEQSIGIMNSREQRVVDLGQLNNNKNSNTISVKLPKLHIKKFSGTDITLWREFWSSFESSIHLNNNLTSVDKLNYLFSLLTGDAFTCIEGIKICNENYPVAISLLRERYGDTELIIYTLYNDLQNIPQSNHQTINLRLTYDKLEKIFRSLESLNENINQRYVKLLICSKFPSSFLGKLEQECNTFACDTRELRTKIHKMILVKERSEFFTKNNQFNTNKVNGKSHSLKQDQIAISKSNNSKFEINKSKHYRNVKQQKCIYCTLSHWSDQCTEFPTLNSRKEKLKNCCLKCLRYNSHETKDCKSTSFCAHCKKPDHHRSLCPTKLKQNDVSSLLSINKLQVPEILPKEIVFLQTAVLEILNPKTNSNIEIRMLLDSGSHMSYITEKVFKQLSLTPIYTEFLSIFIFGKDKPTQISSHRVDIAIKLKNKDLKIIEVNVVPTILKSFSIHPKIKQIHHQFPYLTFAENLNTQLSDIDFVIGNNYYFDIIEMEKIEVNQGLHLINSKLGWILSGRVPEELELQNSVSLLSYNHSVIPEIPLEHDSTIDLKQLWSFDSIGINDNPLHTDDDEAMSLFNNSITITGNRYRVSWPWRQYPPPDLSPNYQLALGRLKSLYKRLKTNKELLLKYNDIMLEQLKNNIIEEVTDKSITSDIVHYLPHHAVITPTKSTTKIRIVYDASSKSKSTNKSLNECLYRGRILLEDLCSLLLRFRLHKFAFVADIEKAFLQIELHYPDRDVTRFIWLKDPNLGVTDTNLQVFRFTRVVFGVISSPFILCAVIKNHLNKLQNSKIAQHISNNIYMDNILIGIDDESLGYDMYKEAKTIFNDASMNIREWGTNSQITINQIPENDKIKTNQTSVLGLIWNTNTDKLNIKINSTLDISLMNSKRSILKFVSSIFDPLGLFSPVILLGKIFIRDLWKLKLEWDESLQTNLIEQWQEIYTKIQPLSLIQLPRFLDMNTSNTYDLICFTDASKQAYSALIYLRQTNNSKIKTHLIFSKIKLAPIKDITIPRLELMGVLIGVRAIKFVGRSLVNINIANKYLWTDSQCVLHWISSTKTLPIFIENRIKEIKLDPYIKFRYTPREDNPADIATKGCSAQGLLESPLWFKGPLWLSQHENTWPKHMVAEPQTEPQFNISHSLMTNCIKNNQIHLKVNSPYGINESNYSSLNYLLNITSYCTMFVSKLRKITTSSHISLHQFIHSRLLWEKYVQKQAFQQMFFDINSNKQNSLVNQLSLFIDNDGLLRCKGRLQHSHLKYDEKYPILLPSQGHYTNLIVTHYHNKLMHVGTAHTLHSVRSRYWLIKGRQTVKNILKNCFKCHRLEGKAFSLPSLPPLPHSRVCKVLPFCNVGLDYFGPLLIKNRSDYDKTWICLFTCLVTRAVHLELVFDMTASEFLLGFQRFVSRRNIKPSLVISDNAKQFQLVGALLSPNSDLTFTHKELNDYSNDNSIVWKFIPECSPWAGGVYERLIGIIKKCLTKTLWKKSLTLSQLLTVTSEIESILNTRPLMYVGSEIEDEVVTPLNLISLQSQDVTLLPLNINQNSRIQINLLEIWKKGRKLLENYWKLWKEGYLKSLRERKEDLRKEDFIPKVGEVVLIEDNLPRCKWKLGRVERLNYSNDSKIRSVIIKIQDNKIQRPINKVYPLEI